MAPKRTSGASSPRKAPPAKKAKRDAPEAPLLSFITSLKDLPKACRDMLVAAVPICLEVTEGDRHKFQTEVLNRVASLVKDAECKKRDAVSAVEAELTQVESDKDKAFGDSEAKRIASESKKNDCDEKGKVVDGAIEVTNAAQAELTAAQKTQDEFNTKKAALFAEQENFAKLLSESLQPLKDGTHAGNWNKRNKEIGVLKKKILELGAQESLGDALAAALKEKSPEKREGAFAKATLQFTDEIFAKHTAKVAADIAGLDPEEAGNAAAIAAAEATLAERKAALQALNKDWDEMQDVWLQLEKDSAEASSSLKSIEVEIPGLTDQIEKAKAALDKFLEVPALFMKLKEHSTAVPDEPEAEPKEEEHAEEAAEEAAEGVADEAMQVA